MIERVLTNLAYLFYPKNICSYKEKDKYFISDEYKRLDKRIIDFDSKKNRDLRIEILKVFEQDYTLKNFRDFSLFEWKDRCMTFNLTLIEDGEMYTISLHLSILIPFYVIRCNKNIIELFFSKSKIEELENENVETRKISELISDIEAIVENKLLYRKFPKELLGVIIPDLSFQDSKLGDFNMFNAFFNNSVIITEK